MNRATLHLPIPSPSYSEGENATRTAECLRELGSAFNRLDANVGAIRQEQLRQGSMLARMVRSDDLPPMRPESPSTVEVVVEASEEIARRYEADVKNPRTPPPDAKKVKSFSEEVFKDAVSRVKADMWDTSQRELEKERAASRRHSRKLWIAIVVGSLSTAGLVAKELLALLGH